MSENTKEYYPNNVLHFCPHCGAGSLDSIGIREFFCQICQFPFFMNVASAAAALILNEQNQLLLTRRNRNPMKGMLDLPGGFIEPFETAEEALKREIQEELNLRIVSMEYFTNLPNEYTYKGMTYFTLDFAFICKVESTDNLVLDDENSEVVWVDPQLIHIDKIGLCSIKKIVEEFVKKSSKNQ